MGKTCSTPKRCVQVQHLNPPTSLCGIHSWSLIQSDSQKTPQAKSFLHYPSKSNDKKKNRERLGFAVSREALKCLSTTSSQSFLLSVSDRGEIHVKLPAVPYRLAQDVAGAGAPHHFPFLPRCEGPILSTLPKASPTHSP